MAVATAHPSNSIRINPQTPPHHLAGVGIDKLALSLPIVSFSQDPMLWNDVWGNGARIEDLHQGAHLSISIKRIQRSLRCWLEINPSRVLDPHGWSLCRTEDVFSAVTWALDQLRGRAEFWADTDDILVKRLDIARDFQVADPQFFISGLRHLHRPYSRNPCVFFDERTGAASTLLVGTSRSKGGNHVQLYDRYLKTGRPEQRGTLRWEVQARTWTERYGGIRTLADLTPERVERLAVDRWDWSRMGESVLGSGEFIDLAYAAEWSQSAMRDRFIGQCFGLLHGKLVLNEKAREEFKKTQRRLGISLSATTGAARRLDFESGLEVLVDADISDVA